MRQRSNMAVVADAPEAAAHLQTAYWGVLEFLAAKQREIERKYDYRYSVLTGVFARLLAEG